MTQIIKHVVNATKEIVNDAKNATSVKTIAEINATAVVKKILNFVAEEPIPLPPKRV